MKLNPVNNGLHGTVTPPGDKSISHRALIIGALSQGVTSIHNFLNAKDALTTMDALRLLDVRIDALKSYILVHGQNLVNFRPPLEPLNFNNSGTTTRLMLGLLSGQPFTTEITGDASLKKRPMDRVITPLSTMGAEFTSDNHLPLKVTGKRPLKALHYQLPVASAQVKSALLLAGLYADKPTLLIEKAPTRDHTELMLKRFGADIATDGLTITMQPHPQLVAQDIIIPGDFSSAAFFIIAGLIVPNSQIKIDNVGLNPSRTGLLNVLNQMGAHFDIQRSNDDVEPVGTIDVQTQALHAITLNGQLIPNVIDELPLIALAATQAEGTTIISDAKELRVKESDRIKAVTEILTAFGADITEQDDGFIIKGKVALHAPIKTVHTYGDHRLAMITAIAALLCSQPVELEAKEEVEISYPTFFDDLTILKGGK